MYQVSAPVDVALSLTKLLVDDDGTSLDCHKQSLLARAGHYKKVWITISLIPLLYQATFQVRQRESARRAEVCASDVTA